MHVVVENMWFYLKIGYCKILLGGLVGWKIPGTSMMISSHGRQWWGMTSKGASDWDIHWSSINGHAYHVLTVRQWLSHCDILMWKSQWKQINNQCLIVIALKMKVVSTERCCWQRYCVCTTSLALWNEERKDWRQAVVWAKAKLYECEHSSGSCVLLYELHI